MPLWNSEYALYAVGIAHCDLDVGFGVERRAGIEGFSFGKDSTNRFNQPTLTLIDRVQMLYDCAIELPPKTINVFREYLVCFFESLE